MGAYVDITELGLISFNEVLISVCLSSMIYYTSSPVTLTTNSAADAHSAMVSMTSVTLLLVCLHRLQSHIRLHM